LVVCLLLPPRPQQGSTKSQVEQVMTVVLTLATWKYTRTVTMLPKELKKEYSTMVQKNVHACEKYSAQKYTRM
jgi:hypothetical protein